MARNVEVTELVSKFVPLAANLQPTYTVCPDREAWKFNRILADTDRLKRENYKGITLLVIIQDNVIAEIPLFLIDSQSRREMDALDDINKRVRALELGEALRSGRMSPGEYEVELEAIAADRTFPPFIVQSGARLGVRLSDGVGMPSDMPGIPVLFMGISARQVPQRDRL